MLKEDYDYLKQFDNQINTATKSNYMRSIPIDCLTKIKEIYERLIGAKYETNLYCSVCVLKLIKLISKYYYEYKPDTAEKTDIGTTTKGTNKKTNNRRTKK